MEAPLISADDLTDVMEMTNAIEGFIKKTLEDNQASLALSALMSASINSMLVLCDTLDEVIVYRNVFMKMMDSSIQEIQIRNRQ